jgi:cytoskeletal protein RodZ
LEDIELGTLLKKARQEKGLSLNDIQELTKIRKKYLEAIEANDFDVLPAKVYLKIFVKGYAREVDINYKELLNYYPVLNIKEENKNIIHKDYLDGTKVSHKIKRNNDSKRSFLKIVFIVIVSLFLIATAVYTFQYFRNSEIRLLNQNINEEQNIDQSLEISESKAANNEQNSEGDRTRTEVEKELAEVNNENDILSSINSEILSDQNTEIINQNNFNNIEGINSAKSDKITEIIISDNLREENNIVEEILSNNPDNKNSQELSIDENIQLELNQNNNSANNTNNSSENEISENNEANNIVSDLTTLNDEFENPSETDQKTEQKTQINAEERTIRFMADDTVWVNIRAAGETAFIGILEAGDSRKFELKNELYIKIGNAGAITAVINGEEKGPWSGQGGIAELEFTVVDNEIQVNNLREDN